MKTQMVMKVTAVAVIATAVLSGAILSAADDDPLIPTASLEIEQTEKGVLEESGAEVAKSDPKAAETETIDSADYSELTFTDGVANVVSDEEDGITEEEVNALVVKSVEVQSAPLALKSEQETAVDNAVAYEVSAADPSVEMRVYAYFSDIPAMIRVAECESRFRQFEENGEVLRGRAVSADVGVMQINEYFHLERATRLGYDIHTLEGNLGYARFLYNKQGLQPWSASKPCWGTNRSIASS